MLLFKVFSDSGQERGELRKIRNHLNHREKEVKMEKKYRIKYI